MSEVKICGITNLEDAYAACECGADALGFLFYDRSPRYVAPERAREIISRLPRSVAKVGVFVNRDLAEVRRIFLYCGLDLVQVHGSEGPEYCRSIPSAILIKAVRPKAPEDLQGLDQWTPTAFLVDSGDPIQYGGTGRVGDWGLAAELAGRYQVILAGGLNQHNVRTAITAVSPAAVDVGSGVEERPGKKDRRKMRALLQEVRSARGGGAEGIFSKAAGGGRIVRNWEGKDET
jgi:phosphoribosylanthranilate isomerase